MESREAEAACGEAELEGAETERQGGGGGKRWREIKRVRHEERKSKGVMDEGGWRRVHRDWPLASDIMHTPP